MSWYTSSEIKDWTDVMSFQTKLGQKEAVLGVKMHFPGLTFQTLNYR